MTPRQAVEFFGSQVATAKALNITKVSVNQWVRNGEIPVGRQYQIQVLTRGKLKASAQKA